MKYEIGHMKFSSQNSKKKELKRVKKAYRTPRTPSKEQICIVRIPILWGKGDRKYLKTIMVENFPNMRREMDIRIMTPKRPQVD